jgi:hypothetical protein
MTAKFGAVDRRHYLLRIGSVRKVGVPVLPVFLISMEPCSQTLSRSARTSLAETLAGRFPTWIALSYSPTWITALSYRLEDIGPQKHIPLN